MMASLNRCICKTSMTDVISMNRIPDVASSMQSSDTSLPIRSEFVLGEPRLSRAMTVEREALYPRARLYLSRHLSVN